MNDHSHPTSIDPQAVWAGSLQLLALANRGMPRVEFLREASQLILQLLNCDALHVRLADEGLEYEWDMSRDESTEPKFRVLSKSASTPITADTRFPSVLELPVSIDEKHAGILALQSKSPGRFPPPLPDFYDGVARAFGLAVANRRAQARLRERIKELTCMYEMSRLVREPAASLAETLEAVARLLPSAWQFPEIAGARLLIGPHRHVAGNRSAALHVQTAPIMTEGRESGIVEVFYTAERAEFAEGPFLREEQHLIDGVAREIGQLLDRTQAAEARGKLEEQVRRADRLATIGQLAAGVAHELNEPLGNILGFAQLIEKTGGLGEQVDRDLHHIIDASLHGRQIIKNLLLFARKAPAAKKPMDVNPMASESISLFSARCAKHGIRLNLELSAKPATINADASQLKQVLVNLAINAIQAMPTGGALTIRTEIDEAENRVTLSIGDTGSGMSEEIRRRIFDPFFTTKDVGEGTGLGLSVVHGIVAEHGGEIRVESEPGRGSTFSIHFARCHDSPSGGEYGQ